MTSETDKKIKILHIEDDSSYVAQVVKYLSVHPFLGVEIEISAALWREEAYHMLKKNIYNGLIIDLDIPPASVETLARLGEERLSLGEIIPVQFSGLLPLIKVQEFHQWITKVPKLFLSEHSFEMYAEYCAKVKGDPSLKYYREKEDDDDTENGNVMTIINWLKENFIEYD